MKLVSILLLILSVVITTASDFSLLGSRLGRSATSDNEIDNEAQPDDETRHLSDVLLTGINGRIPTTRGIGYHEYSGSDGKGGGKGGGKGSKGSKTSKPYGKGKGTKGPKSKGKGKGKGSKGEKYGKPYEGYKKEKPYSDYGKMTKPYN